MQKKLQRDVFTAQTAYRAFLSALFYGVFWMMVAGLNSAREQEEIGPRHRSLAEYLAADEREKAADRSIAMNVAVANSMLDRGKAKDAIDLYKKAIRTGETQSVETANALTVISQENEWSKQELLFGNFSGDQKKQAVKHLLAQGNARLDQGQYDRAVEVFEKIFLLDPLNAKASRGIDKARRELIERAEAEGKVLEKVDDEANREAVQIELNRAWVALKEGLEPRARMHVDRVLLMDPENHEAKRLLAQLEGKA